MPFRIRWLSHLITVAIGFLSWVFFRILNRTTIIGKENIVRRKRLLIVSNHVTLIDSFLVGCNLFFPVAAIKPWLPPFHLPDEQNFFHGALFAGKLRLLGKIIPPFAGFLFAHLKCIPVKRGRKDFGALLKASSVLEQGTVHIFPEGTRTRDGKLGRGREGVGYLISRTQPVVLPVYIEGMENVMPVGCKIPKIGKRITIIVGRPFTCTDVPGDPKSRDTWQLITQKVMGEIAALAPCAN
ncbi:MAG: lysophospholipid acyltransferase family protein [Patescibacteria group bacterium]|jgi:1-acyl-sn-glycerol-3-phosphate acyltransferase